MSHMHYGLRVEICEADAKVLVEEFGKLSERQLGFDIHTILSDGSEPSDALGAVVKKILMDVFMACHHIEKRRTN